MNPDSQRAPAAASDRDQALRIYRSLAVTAAVVIPGFGIVRRIIDPATVDPLFERLVISLFLLGYVAISLLHGRSHRHVHGAFAVVLYSVSAGVIHMAYVNGMSVNTSYGLLIMLFACSLAFRTRVMLAGYLLMANLGIGATIWLSEVVEIDPLFFLTTVVAVSALTYAVQVNRIFAETNLREARDLAEAAVEARGRFLANMSHEIRTPMNGVIGMASLLEDTELTATQQDYLRTIRTSGDSLLMLINDILDFSKIEAGHVEVEREPFDPCACAEGATELVAQAAREKGLELVLDCDPGMPEVVIGDSLRLRQVLVNLLSNAVKFTRDGAVHLSLSARREGESGLRLTCAVRDTGIGIAADRADGLFQAFAQADSSTTRRFGGTGLGLSISKQLVERMGGTIRVQSVERAGATFEFDVHLEVPPRQDTAPVSAVAGLPVLVFEPLPATRAALIRRLEGWGVACEAVSDEGAARTALARREFAAVIVGCSRLRLQMLRQAIAPDGTAVPNLVRLAPIAECPMEAGPDAVWTLYRPVRRVPLLRVLESAGIVDAGGRAEVPVQVPADQGIRPAGAGTTAAGGLRILLAEDNPVNQRVTLMMLGRLGYQADLAADGREAVAALRRDRYDVVLMDLQMPLMDGLEASRRIRQESPHGARPRIIAMTANAMRGDRDACIAAGMDDYLCKPVKIDELRAVLGQADAAKSTSSTMSSSTSKNEWTSVART